MAPIMRWCYGTSPMEATPYGVEITGGLNFGKRQL
jgi:hypothetical protein